MSRQRAFTLIELLVVVAIIAILASLLLPALAGAKVSARKVLCMNNQKQIALATMMYGDDFNGQFPRPPLPTTDWIKSMIAAGYFESLKSFEDPAEHEGPHDHSDLRKVRMRMSGRAGCEHDRIHCFLWYQRAWRTRGHQDAQIQHRA